MTCIVDTEHQTLTATDAGTWADCRIEYRDAVTEDVCLENEFKEHEWVAIQNRSLVGA